MNDERNNITTLVPTKSDKEFAEELKKEIVDTFSDLLKVLDKAKANNFDVRFSISPNAFGKMHISELTIFKTF